MSTIRNNRNEISEMTLGLTRSDRQRNATIRQKLKVEHTADEIQSYQKNWLQYVEKMEHL
jgi:hypothetical protein